MNLAFSDAPLWNIVYVVFPFRKSSLFYRQFRELNYADLLANFSKWQFLVNYSLKAKNFDRKRSEEERIWLLANRPNCVIAFIK